MDGYAVLYDEDEDQENILFALTLNCRPRRNITLQVMALRLDLTTSRNNDEKIFSVNDKHWFGEVGTWLTLIPKALSTRGYRFVIGMTSSPWIWATTGAGKPILLTPLTL